MACKDLVRYIVYPETVQTLEELGVVKLSLIKVQEKDASIIVSFIPLTPTCEYVSFVGLCMFVKLSLSPNILGDYTFEIMIHSDSHKDAVNINSKFKDKTRIEAACDKKDLMEIIHRYIQDPQLRCGSRKGTSCGQCPNQCSSSSNNDNNK